MHIRHSGKRFFIAVLTALLAASLAGCGAAANKGGGAQASSGGERAPRKVTLMLDWTPNTNHTGIYVAQKQGYYAEEGLEVDIILPGEAGGDLAVAAGEADFGVSYQEQVTFARTQGIPLVSVAAVIQHNTSGFAAPKSVGLKSPKDFEGKTYGGWGGPTEAPALESLMRAVGADFSKLEIVNSGSADFFTMQEAGIDFAWIYYGWTGIEAELRGVEIDIVWLTDYSDKLDFYTPVIVTSEQRIRDEPELVEKFVRATARGYIYAAEHPEESARMLLEAVPELDEELVVASQKWLSAKYIDDAPKWGVQKLEVWENFASWLDEFGLLEGEFDAQAAFTNDFIP